jgi:hypothetical protein
MSKCSAFALAVMNLSLAVMNLSLAVMNLSLAVALVGHRSAAPVGHRKPK